MKKVIRCRMTCEHLRDPDRCRACNPVMAPGAFLEPPPFKSMGRPDRPRTGPADAALENYQAAREQFERAELERKWDLELALRLFRRLIDAAAESLEPPEPQGDFE